MFFETVLAEGSVNSGRPPAFTHASNKAKGGAQRMGPSSLGGGHNLALGAKPSEVWCRVCVVHMQIKSMSLCGILAREWR